MSFLIKCRRAQDKVRQYLLIQKKGKKEGFVRIFQEDIRREGLIEDPLSEQWNSAKGRSPVFNASSDEKAQYVYSRITLR